MTIIDLLNDTFYNKKVTIVDINDENESITGIVKDIFEDEDNNIAFEFKNCDIKIDFHDDIIIHE